MVGARFSPIIIKGLLVMQPLDIVMAGATGLEPATSGVTGRRSNQLNYAPESFRKSIIENIAKLDPATFPSIGNCRF